MVVVNPEINSIIKERHLREAEAKAAKEFLSNWRRGRARLRREAPKKKRRRSTRKKVRRRRGRRRRRTRRPRPTTLLGKM